MNLDDLEKVLNSLDIIDSDLGGKSTEKLRKKLIKKSKEDVLSFEILKRLVLLIEFIGLSGNKSFKRIASKHYGEAKARALWYRTKNTDPEKIEVLKRKLAYSITNAYVQWMNSNRVKDASEIRLVLRCLKNKNMELLYWAFREIYLKSKDAKFKDLIPDYQQWIDAIEKEAFSETATRSLMKEIASSE